MLEDDLCSIHGDTMQGVEVKFKGISSKSDREKFKGTVQRHVQENGCEFLDVITAVLIVLLYHHGGFVLWMFTISMSCVTIGDSSLGQDATQVSWQSVTRPVPQGN